MLLLFVQELYYYACDGDDDNDDDDDDDDDDDGVDDVVDDGNADALNGQTLTLGEEDGSRVFGNRQIRGA